MPRAERPLIAINGLLSLEPAPRLVLANRYAEAVLRAGGLPLVLPPVGGPADLERLVARVDGLLLSGGDDFDTARLGLGPTHPAAQPVPTAKQDFDFELARLALDRALPTLGICYGMQLLALVGGGSLLQHLPDDRPGLREHRGGVLHPVHFDGSSKLRALLEVDQLEVVSRHHQAIGTTAGPWRVSARDDQGLIEAVESRDHPFALGVQWHPELSPEGDPNQRLFLGLVHAASLHSPRRAWSPC